MEGKDPPMQALRGVLTVAAEHAAQLDARAAATVLWAMAAGRHRDDRLAASMMNVLTGSPRDVQQGKHVWSKGTEVGPGGVEEWGDGGPGEMGADTLC